VSHPIPDVRQKRLDVPASLASLIAACMGKLPDERPATMEAVVAALEAIGHEVETTSSGATVQLAPVAASVLGTPAAYGPTHTASSQIGAASIAMQQPPPKSGTGSVLAFITVLAVAAIAGGYFVFVKNKGGTQANPTTIPSTSTTAVAASASASAKNEPVYGEDKNPFTWTDASVVAAGNAVYVSRCARCHGARGDGAGTDIPAGLRPRSFSDVVLPPGTLDVYYFHIIRQGIEKNGGEAMPPFKDKLSTKETWQVVTFINTLRPKMRKVDVEKEILAGPPNPTEESKARGKELYATRCAGCHGDELRGDGPASVMIPEPPTDLKDGAWNDKNKKPNESDLVHIFRTTTQGYGEYMGAFSNLSTNDRWAIARYVTLVRTGTMKP
jgi:mono/diheme cytochrome c family protein